MLSIKKIKLIKSLESKKSRKEQGLFLVEGDKMVSEMLASGLTITYLAATEEWYRKSQHQISTLEQDLINPKELNKISFLKTPQNALCVVKIPNYSLNLSDLKNSLVLLLDTIQDPGNLGTIVRLADWFGIRNIICSEESADLYNPKVVQATMGALARVKVCYVSLPEFMIKAKQLNIPIYGAFMDGENLYKCDLTANGLIVMGNEGNGISEDTAACISRRINIPSYPAGSTTSESLNVAIATSIICSEFRRRIICKG